MELTMTTGRPALILATVVGMLLALIPLVAFAAGTDVNSMIDACRSIMGSVVGGFPCAGGS